MKMVSIVDGIFWGGFLIVLGIWLIVRGHFPVHLPLIRIIVAALFIYVGVRVLVAGPFVGDRNTAIFSESTMRYSPESGRDYNLIFSSGVVDLSEAAATTGSVRAEVNVIFGSGTLRINPAAPVRVSMTSAFGTVESPNGHSIAFGDSVYTTPSYREGTPALEVHAASVFGRLIILP